MELARLIGPVITIILAIIGFAVMWGKFKNQVDEIKKRNCVLEKKMETKTDKEDCAKDMAHGQERFREIKSDLTAIREIQTAQGESIAGMQVSLEFLVKAKEFKD